MSAGSFYRIEQSQRNKRVLITNGYVMILNKVTNETYYWCCVQKQTNNVPVQLSVNYME